jgi:hypothetical protein
MEFVYQRALKTLMQIKPTKLASHAQSNVQCVLRQLVAVLVTDPLSSIILIKQVLAFAMAVSSYRLYRAYLSAASAPQDSTYSLSHVFVRHAILTAQLV